MLCYVFVGEVLHAFSLNGVRDSLVVGSSFALFLLLEESPLLCLLLHEVVELLLVEVLIDLILVVELVLAKGRSSAGLRSSALRGKY